jgi:hypothetical protein
MSYSIIEKSSYTLYINSTDKLSGTKNNNASFQVNWDDFLPVKYGLYKMIWSLNSVGGFYKDSNNVSVTVQASAAGGSNINMASTSNLYVGMGVVSSTYIAANSYIVAITNNTLVQMNSNVLVAIPNGTSVSFTGSIFSGGIVKVDFGSGSLSFDTANKSGSYTIGYIQRDPQSTTSSSNTLSAFYAQNPPKTISRPNLNFLNVQIYNAQVPTSYLVNTDISGNAQTDMTNYNLCMEFVPIDKSVIDK